MQTPSDLEPGDHLICRQHDGYAKRYASCVKPGDIVVFGEHRDARSFYGFRLGQAPNTEAWQGIKVWRYANFSPISFADPNKAEPPVPCDKAVTAGSQVFYDKASFGMVPADLVIAALQEGLEGYFAVFADTGAAQLITTPLQDLLGVDLDLGISVNFLPKNGA